MYLEVSEIIINAIINAIIDALTLPGKKKMVPRKVLF